MRPLPPRGCPPRRLVHGAVTFPVRPARWFPERFRPPALELRLYWKVIVFPSKETLRAYAAWREAEEEGDALGMVVPMHVITFRPGRRPGRLRSKVGEILLCRDHLGASIVSHEALHAALATLRMTGPEDALELGADGVGDQEAFREERLCHLLGNIDRHLVLGLHARRLY